MVWKLYVTDTQKHARLVIRAPTSTKFTIRHCTRHRHLSDLYLNSKCSYATDFNVGIFSSIIDQISNRVVKKR
jgi:hypothetical protein